MRYLEPVDSHTFQLRAHRAPPKAAPHSRLPIREDWINDIIIEGTDGPLSLAQLTAQSTTLAMDVTTSDVGEAGDGLFLSWRQVFIIFNGSDGGWQQPPKRSSTFPSSATMAAA